MIELPKSILAVSIKHFNGYSHVIRILKEFFEGIPNISNITTIKQYTLYDAAEFVYIVTKTLERIFFKLYDYIGMLNLFETGSNKRYYLYTPKSLFDCRTKAFVDKKALNQYIKGI